jgi:hypothetical protein
VRILRYADDGSIWLTPDLPDNFAAEVQVPITFYTGYNAPVTPLVINDYGRRLLGDPPPRTGCQAAVPVFSEDGAPADGDVVTLDVSTGRAVDRRPVAAGTPLNFTLLAPCGTWLRVLFEASGDDAAPSGFLPSQYGADADYGTPDSLVIAVPSYHTAFANLTEVR